MIDHYEADVQTAQDYYPFGMIMPGRLFTALTVPGGSVTGTTQVNGFTVPVDLALTSRTGNEPTQYTATRTIDLDEGFESADNDDVTAYLTDTSYAGTGNGGSGADGVAGASKYRYGFNGKENDNEVKGIGDQIDYGMRVYDPRAGRFLSVDPLVQKFPFYTPYQFSGNTPIQATDLDGREDYHYTLTFNAKTGEAHLKLNKIVNEHSFLGISWKVQGKTYYVDYPQGGFGNRSFTFTEVGASTRGNTTANFEKWLANPSAFTNDPSSIGGATIMDPGQLFYSNAAVGLASVNDALKWFSDNNGAALLNRKVSIPTAEGEEVHSLPTTKTNVSTKFGGRTIIVDENLSPKVAEGLQAQGYNVKTFPKGTSDESIIDWAKNNNGAVLTNNIKDFKGKGVMTLEVPTTLTSKNQTQTLIDRINVLNNNIQSHGNGVYNSSSNVHMEKDATLQH